MLVILGLTITAALAMGLAARGKFTNLSRISFSWIPILYIALGIGLIPGLTSGPRVVDLLMLAIAYMLVAAFLIRNVVSSRDHLRAGLIVATLGWFLNAVVILANGAMPLSLWAYARSGQTEVPTPGRGGYFKIEIADSDTRLSFLGDVIPIRVIKQVVSIGDIVLVLGIGVAIVQGMRGAGRRVAEASELNQTRREPTS